MIRAPRARLFARLAAALVSTGAAAAFCAPACSPQAPGARFDCSCSFLTDYDDGSSVRITVCAAASRAEPAGAEPAARSCAVTGAPAPVEKCACEPASDASACVVGECVTR